MESHSLIRFLDKFVYRNAKTTDSARGMSIMQPLRATKDSGDIWLGGYGARASATQVNSASFWNKKVDDVNVEDVFFHEYFQHMSKPPKESVKPTQAVGEDEDEEAGEDEIWKALVSAQPDIEEDGSEMGFSDLDDLDMASEDGSSPAMSLESDSDDAMEGASDGEFDEDDDLDGLVAVGSGEESEKEQDKKEDKRRTRKKMLKGLPTFASVDDYAELLAQEDEDL